MFTFFVVKICHLGILEMGRVYLLLASTIGRSILVSIFIYD